MRFVADHILTLSFAIADGQHPPTKGGAMSPDFAAGVSFWTNAESV